MSKDLGEFKLSIVQCERDLQDFRQLLDDHTELSEHRHILPFFQARPHLAAIAGSANTQLHEIDRLSHEFDLFGNFRCDCAVGDSTSRAYTLVEFEDARPNSIFEGASKYHETWGRRFEHGFSQLVDWFWAVDLYRGNPDFRRRFGEGHVQFSGMLVIGRSQFLEPHQVERLQWRLDRVLINTNKVTCVTFDQLYDFIAKRLEAVRTIATSGDLI